MGLNPKNGWRANRCIGLNHAYLGGDSADGDVFGVPGRPDGRAGRCRPGPNRPSSSFETPADLTPQGKIDELVFASLKRLGIRPANLCSDGVFVRRVYLDVIGTLPTAEEARQFLADHDPNKRSCADRPPVGAEGVCRLLGDEVERSAAGQGGVPHQALAPGGAGLSSLDPHVDQGEHALRPVRAGTAHRKRQQFPRAAGQFLPRHAKPGAAGHRAGRGLDVHGSAGGELAERPAGPAWRPSSPQIGYKSTAEWKEEIVFFDPGKAAAQADGKGAPAAVFPDGTRARLPPGKDPREVFADWLIRPENPWFARNIVNRIWCWLSGAGHHPRARRHPSRQSAGNSRVAGLVGTGVGRGALRPEAHLPVDPELEDLSAFFPSRRPTVPRARRSLPTIRCGGWKRRC